MITIPQKHKREINEKCLAQALLLIHGGTEAVLTVAMTGNHPTSTGLSMAKHIFDPGPTQG